MDSKEHNSEELEVAGSDSGATATSSLGGDTMSQTSEDEPTSLIEEANGKEHGSRKTFDLVMPPPVSTSTRAYVATRPVSMSVGANTSSPRKTSNGSTGTPKKWVVNVPPPLAGFSSSPSAQSRLSERLSTRFDSAVLAQLNFGPAIRNEGQALQGGLAPQKEAENELETTSSPRIELTSSDNELEDTTNGSEVAQPPTPTEQDRELSEPILRDVSTLSTASETSLDGSIQSEPLLSPRSKPEVPAKSAALLERRKEMQRNKPSSEVSTPTGSLSPSGHKHAPPPVPRRKSGYFEKGNFREPGSHHESSVSNHSADTDPDSTTDRVTQNRKHRIIELARSEAFYVRSLKYLIERFLVPMRDSLATDSPLISAEGSKLICSNIEMIYKIHEPFAAEISKLEKDWNKDSELGPLMLGLAPYLRIYSTYITKYNKAMEVFLEAMKHKSFRRFISEGLAGPGAELLDWPSYYIQPVQRIPKYLIILSETLKETPESHPDHGKLQKALDTLTSLALEINDSTRNAEALTACAHIQSRLSYPEGVGKIELVTPTRRYHREGQFDVFLNGIATPYNYLILFNDALLITKSKRKHLRFDGFLLLQHTQVQTFESVEFDASSPPSTPHVEHDTSYANAGSSNPDDIPSVLKRKSIGPIVQSSSSSSSLVPNSSPSAHQHHGSTGTPSSHHHHHPAHHQHHASHTGGSSPSSSSHNPPISTVPSHAGTVHSTSLSLTFRSLVIPATVVVIFHSQEDFNNWKQEASIAASKLDTIPTPESFPDRVLSIETNLLYHHAGSGSNAASTTGNTTDTDDSVTSNSRKSGSQSLGSSKSKHRLRRLLTIGSKSKKDAVNAASSSDAPSSSPGPPGPPGDTPL